MKASLRLSFAVCASALLSGCVGGMSDFSLSNFSTSRAETTQVPSSHLANANINNASGTILELLSRESVLTEGTPYAQVSRALMDSSAGVAEAELRAAKLKAVARSKNWLPTVGPSISLTSLGQFTAGLLVDQVIYDNGKRRAERDFAVADVDVSAVALSEDVNDRVADGLKLYITTAQAREKAGMSERGLGRMGEFGRVVSERVKGGVSSLSDQRVVTSKISEMRYQAALHREAEATARAELSALTKGAELPSLSKAVGVGLPSEGVESLSLLRARSEATRAQAEAKAAKAGLFPALRIGGIISENSSAAASYEGTGLGFGTKADMEAIDARAAASAARVSLVEEQSVREVSRLMTRLEATERQERDSRQLVQQARANYRIFQDQFEAGEKTVMDVLNVYEQMIREELKHIDLKYEIALTQVEIARLKGALVRGGDI